MRIYVGRHGDAGAFDPDPARERARSLTDDGRSAAQRVGRSLRATGDVPKLIIASPFARALETADIYGKILGCGVTTEDGLQPDRDLLPMMFGLLDDKQMRRIMLIGHHDNIVPMLKRLGEGRGVDPFQKAEVRRLKIDRKDGEWKERKRFVS